MDSVICDRLLELCDTYTDFIHLAETCMNFYKVYKLIKGRWLSSRFKKLGTFVESKDLEKLIKILLKIRDGTLKDRVSVLCITGPFKGSSGKTTLRKIILGMCEKSKKTCSTSTIGFANVTNSIHYGGNVTQFVKSIVFIQEIPDLKDVNIVANNLHKYMNCGLTFRRLFGSNQNIYKPGTAIIMANGDLKVNITNKEESWSREELPEESWNGFEWVPIENFDSPEGKVPRYPLYLHLPYSFKHNEKLTIVDDCVNELSLFL
ncbi:MAG: hypothetical protein Barrevirus3_7 [Barrevirus sp.]|uniref:Uncharacterized protein n=1 Tax=Barrevirus sp. TaxID=2487763 RepID=A0A3G4ZPS9_9VIRU|nr:MAG: hypothetical protein Barrevirus3_7 [Barrevirus sp.]